MGKPLCRKCKAEVEEESREQYRRGTKKEYPGNLYQKDVYQRKID